MSEHLPRLNTPGRRRSWWPRVTIRKDAFGRFAEGFARFMGTPAFLVWMTVFVVVWVSWNLVAVFFWQFDPYPFILLNLFFSTQASYSAPLILLASNRQEDRDRVTMEHDREVAAQARADMEFLAREVASIRMRMQDVATRDFIRSELRDLLDELEETRELQAELRRKRGED